MPNITTGTIITGTITITVTATAITRPITLTRFTLTHTLTRPITVIRLIMLIQATRPSVSRSALEADIGTMAIGTIGNKLGRCGTGALQRPGRIHRSYETNGLAVNQVA